MGLGDALVSAQMLLRIRELEDANAKFKGPP
jgi:hypothetical protein